MLLGMDVLTHATIDFQCNQLTFAVPTTESHNINKSVAPLTIDFLDCRISGTPRSVLAATSKRNPPETECKPSSGVETRDGQPNHSTEGPARDLKVFLSRPVKLPPKSTGTTTVTVNYNVLDRDKDLIIHQHALTSNAMIPNMCTRLVNDTMAINYVNLDEEELLLEAGTYIGSGEYLKVNPSDSVYRVTDGNKDSQVRFKPLKVEDIQCDDPERVTEVLAVLNKYRGACWLPGEPMGHYTGEQLKIPLKTDEPVNQRPYRVPYAYEEPLDDQVSGLLSGGVVQCSSSSYNSPLLMVRKKMVA